VRVGLISRYEITRRLLLLLPRLARDGCNPPARIYFSRKVVAKYPVARLGTQFPAVIIAFG